MANTYQQQTYFISPNIHRFLLVLLFSIPFVQCGTADEDEPIAPAEVQNSVEQRGGALGDSLDILFPLLQAPAPVYAGKVDNAKQLYLVTKATISFLENVKEKLKTLDSTGERKDIGDKLLVNTATVDTLQYQLRSLVALAQTGLYKKDKEPTLQEMLKPLQQSPQNNQTWSEHWFQHTHTVAIITILTKIQHDCRKVALFVMADIADNIGALRPV